MERIRLSKSTITQADKDAVMRVLDAEFLGMGEEVQLFEKELQAFIGGDKEVVCVNTGTAALHLALQACGIGPGDEVLVPSLTYIASFQAVSATGAKPIACDVRDDTLFLDVKDAEKQLASKTKAVMPVHYASDSQYMSEVYAFAREYGLRVIEDAAHSFGCKRDGKYVGVEGDILCFSFDGIKNITSGEGGAVVSADPEVISKVKDARLLGVKKDTEKRYAGQRSWEFDVTEQGWRYHMGNIMAAIGREQLKRISSIREKRQTIASRYVNALAGIRNLQFLNLDYPNIIPHIFVIRVKDGKRNDLRKHLIKNNIECGIHYFPNHLLTKYKSGHDFPVTDSVYTEILSLPCHLDLSEQEQGYVIEKAKEFFGSSLFHVGN